MRRNLKNAIMILLIILLFGVNYLVMNRIKDEDYNEVRTYAFEKENGKNIDKKINSKKDIDKEYYLVFISLNGGVALLGAYVVMSKFNQKDINRFIAKPKRVVTYVLIVIGLTLVMTVANVIITKKYFMVADINSVKINKKKEVKYELDTSNVINSKKIDLSNMTKSVTIVDGGDYTITGNFNESLIINTDDDITLTFKDTIITGSESAGLIILKANSVKIITEKDTINSISDFGDTEYNSAIYSKTPITFEGEGILKINGKNLKGSGISASDITVNSGTIVIDSQNSGIVSNGKININDGLVYVKAKSDGIVANNLTIDGGTNYIMSAKDHKSINIEKDFLVNGGVLIATGYEKINMPSENSKQNILCLNLESEILWGTPVALKTVKDELIVSFKAESDFENLLISSDKIKNNKYNLYVDGENSGTLDRGIYYDGKYTSGKKVTINNMDTFETKGTITIVEN